MSEKEPVMCPCCAEQHITDFDELMDKYRTLLEFIKRPRIHEGTAMECLRWIMRDSAEDGLSVQQAMFQHVAIAEFYFTVLRADADLLNVTAKEREPHGTILEDLWGAAMDVAQTLQNAQLTEIALVEVQPDSDIDPLPDVNRGWVVKGGDA